jgi:hypothetical protein
VAIELASGGKLHIGGFIGEGIGVTLGEIFASAST